jgi:hypothetical protein
LNYDTLFEEAAEDAGRMLDVLPYSRHGKAKDSWLLKLHGCRTTLDDIVLTEEDYDTYNHRREAFAGIVQSLLVTRHMLFVGFGLTDPNISRLLRSVERALRDYNVPQHGLGTILTVGDHGLRSSRWNKRFHVEHLRTADADGGDLPTRVRLLELVMDRVAARSSGAHAHLLDPRFDGLLNDRERAARTLAEKFAEDLLELAGETAMTARILGALREMGLRPELSKRSS